MILRPYEELCNLCVGSPVKYLDQITLEEQDAKVVYIEDIAPNKAFVYLASIDEDENDKMEYGIKYKDIMVFDDIPNEIAGGVYRDPVMGEYGHLVGKSY